MAHCITNKIFFQIEWPVESQQRCCKLEFQMVHFHRSIDYNHGRTDALLLNNLRDLQANVEQVVVK